MRKLSLLVCLFLIVGMLGGCAKEKKKIESPDLEQVKFICELATMDYYYHNVAKSTKKAGDGFSHIGEKDREFWIEYTGKISAGINMEKVEMKVNGNVVTVTIPEVEILSSGVDKISTDSYISSGDGWNKNKITAEDQSNAIDDAQREMERTFLNNGNLLKNAQERAKMLIANYIHQLGKASGVEYEIKWVELEEETAGAVDTTKPETK